MKCSVCGNTLQENLPYSPFVVWKGKMIGECCYDRLLRTLQKESLTGDDSLAGEFDGIFADENNDRYHICQFVTAGPGNMGYARTLKIQKL